LVLLPIRHDRTLRRMSRAFEARARAVADAALDLLRAGTDDRALTRLRRHLARLNESALMIDGQLGMPNAIREGTAEAVRHALFDAELAAGALAGAVQQMATLDHSPPADLTARVEAALSAVRSDHWDAAEATARTLEAETSPHTAALAMVTTDEPALTPQLLGHRIAAAMLALSAARRSWSAALDPAHVVGDSLPQDTSDFEPAVELVGGNLPGSAKTASAMTDQDGQRLLARMSLTTRQAIQVAVASGLAIVAGDALSGQRYYWAVLAAFIAFTGTATVAETVTKAFNRTVGTTIGLAAAIPVVVLTGASVPWVLTVVLTSIFFGFYLLQVSYAVMIFFITLVVGELYAVLGMFSADLMLLRLEETAVGGAIGGAVALMVLPIRTQAVVATSRHDLLAELQTLLADLARWLRTPDHPAALAGHARALDAQLHQMQTITRPLTRLSPSATGRNARQHLLIYDGLSYHARRIARTARACTPPEVRIADGLARACDQLVTLAEHLAPPTPRLRRTSLSTTGDLLTALHMAAGGSHRASDPAHGSLAQELGHIHDALIELADTHGFVIDADKPTPSTHGQQPDSGPALAPAFPPGTGSSDIAIRGHVFGPGYAAGAAVVTLVDMNGGQRDSTATDADGGYHLTAPAPGTYLLICIPQPTESTYGAGPHAGLVSVTSHPITHDLVLPWQPDPPLSEHTTPMLTAAKSN
jgi:hypothetical protein